jgi:hypothetical protein
MMLLHAAGLALFAAAGTERAVEYKIHPFMAALLGTVTGVGGGTIRDIFLAHVPGVPQADIYAMAAPVGHDFECHPQAWYFGDTCGDWWWRLLLCSPSRCRLISTGICRASRIRSHLEHGGNLERPKTGNARQAAAMLSLFICFM